MSSDQCEISAYMMNHRVSEQSPMRSNYLTYYKTRRSKSGNRLQKSPSDVETRRFEERSVMRRRTGSNLHKLMPRRSESDLCLEAIRKQKKRSLLTTTLLNSNHEGWDFDHSSSHFGAAVTNGERLLQQKQAKSLKNNQENESSQQDAWKSQRTNCSLTKTIGADSELHKNSTHFERLFGGRSNIHEFSALNAALPSRKLFFMQEYPNNLLKSEAKQATVETAGCNKRRSYIETSRNLFGFSHKLPARDKCSFPETCEGRYESSSRPAERPHTGTIAHDHEMYASYIGDHCRKNRRGRNSNKNSLPQSIVDVDSGLKLHGIRGDSLRRSQTVSDSHTVSDLSSEYPISDCDEFQLGNRNFSHFPFQPELNFDSYLTDKKKVKNGRNIEDKDKVIVKKYDRSSRCKFPDESESVLDSSLSISDKISLSGKRRTKKKRQRSGVKKSPCGKQHAHEEESKIRAGKHYNDHRRQSSKDLDKKDVSHLDNHAHEMEHLHGSDNKIRRTLTLPKDPGVSTKDDDPFKPQWTCTKWAKESRNKNKQSSSTSDWAYEVYSDTCLNSSMNGMPGGFRNAMENYEDIREYDMANCNQLEPGLQRLDYNQQVLCSANFTNAQSEEPHKLNRCETGYDDVLNVGIKPFLVSNRNPLLLNHSERIASKLIGAVWTQMAESEKRNSNTDTINDNKLHSNTDTINGKKPHSNTDTIDDKKNHGHGYQHGQRMAVENKAVKKAQDKYNLQEKHPATENYTQGDNEKKVHIRKAKRETYLDQTYSNCTKQKQIKCVDIHENSGNGHGDTEAPVADVSSMKNSIDEILIRTVHSIKEDIESVFARLNSFDTNKDDTVVKTALSLKDSVQNVLDQAKAVQRNQKSTNIVSAAEVVKQAIKALTTFKTAFAIGALEQDDSHDMSYELYKMGKEEYHAGNEAGSNKHNIHIVSIDSTRKPYYRLAIDTGTDTTGVENSFSGTDVTSCATLCPESVCCSSGTDDTVVTLNAKGDGQRQHGICRSKQTITEGDESLVGSTVLKNLALSAEKTAFSSAESTKSGEKLFDQKFEEMLAKFPTDEREFEFAGIPKSLTRGRSPCSSAGKSKKKRKKSQYSKKRHSSSDKKKQQERSVAGEKPSWKSTKLKHSRNSVSEKSRERDKMKAKPEMLIQNNTGVMMQPVINKTDTSEDMLIEPLISSLALCEITDKSGTTNEATKKYREQMLQPTSKLDIEEGGLEGCSSKESFLKKSLKTWKGSQEYPVTMRDIQIIYKIHSKTTLTDDEESFINSISLHKTEEEIMTVPHDKESTSQTDKKKVNLDIPDPDNTQDSSKSSGGNKQNFPEPSNEAKDLTIPSEPSKPTAADVSMGHDQLKEEGICKAILSTEINESASSECLESDIQGAVNTDTSLFNGYQLAKKSQPKTLKEFPEIPNTICKISDLAEDAVASLDSGQELALESIDKLVSACKDIHEAQLNATIEIQPLESFDASITSGYQKKRETTRQLLPQPDTSVNSQREECIQIQPNEATEKETSKATQNEATDLLDHNTVSMLNASILKLYEEVNKLRVKLETSAEILSPGASPRDEHSKSRSRVDSKKKKHSKDSKSKSRKSSSSSKSSRASSPGYTVGSDQDGRSPKKGHYFEATPLYSDKIQKMSVENVSNTDLTSPLLEVGKLCCVYRKYDTSCPETISEYYDRISKSGEQVPQVTPDAFYLEYDDRIISPAMYIEHASLNTSPANYMVQEEDASSVASYAEPMMVPHDTSESPQHIQYFDKNLSRYAAGDKSPERRGIGRDNYWSDLKTVFPGKAAVIEDTGSPNEEQGRCGVISDDRLNAADPADPADIGFLAVRSNAVIVDEYLSRDKQSIFSEDIVEYTSNTMTAEKLGQQLDEIAAKMNSVSAQLGYHLRNACCNSNTTSDLEDGIRKCESQPLECDDRIHCDLSCDISLLADGCRNKGNFEMTTENPQYCSNICQTDLISKEDYIRDSSDISETNIRNTMEHRNAGDSNESFEVNSQLNCRASGTPRDNNPTNCFHRKMPKVSTANVHQSSNEDVSDQEEETTRPPTPPMWSDSEESLGKKEEDYIASLHIPRIVQCVKDMFFGSTKAQSKEACHQNPSPFDWQSGTGNCSKDKLSNNTEMTPSLSRCQNAASNNEDVVTNIYANRRFEQLFPQNAKDDASEIFSSPLQQNYIFRKRDSRTNSGQQASPSVKTLKKTMPFEDDPINEKSPHYHENSWTGKDHGNYNFIGGNILLTSQPFVHYRSMGYLPAFRHVEETDKTIRHYCDAINTNAGKRLTSLEARCMNIPTTASGQGSSSARIYGCRSENANEADGIRDYGRSPFAGSSPVPGQNDWTSQQCFPEWQSQRASTPLFCRYQDNDVLPNCESTMQQRRPSYVEHCGFRQKRYDNCGSDLLRQEHVRGDEIKHGNIDGGVNKSKCFGVNGNNSGHDVTRKEDNTSVQGRMESEKPADTFRGCTGMFYANEGMMDAIPFECSKKLDSTVNKRLFTARDISETKYYNNSDSIRSVDYENEGQVKHYRQEPHKTPVKEDVEKSQTITEEELEESGGAEEDGEEGRVKVSDDESACNDAASDDMSMEDDERESWYKTTDDESNS